MAKSGAQSLTFKSVTDRKTDKQTDRQTKNQRFWNLNPTKLGMVIEDLAHVLAPPRSGPLPTFSENFMQNAIRSEVFEQIC